MKREKKNQQLFRVNLLNLSIFSIEFCKLSKIVGLNLVGRLMRSVGWSVDEACLLDGSCTVVFETAQNRLLMEIHRAGAFICVPVPGIFQLSKCFMVGFCHIKHLRVRIIPTQWCIWCFFSFSIFFSVVAIRYERARDKRNSFNEYEWE